jgi:outer membrane protein OmpA-like peptidoglycan-associated protein
VAADGCHLTSKPAPLALAVGIRSNVPAASYPPELATLLENTADAGQQISLVRIDGQPKIFRPPPFHTTDQNASARSRDVANYLDADVNLALTGHGTVSAHVPQADVLTALSLAASATGPDGNIVLIDSGLQTVAPLDYSQPGLLMAPPQDVVDFLRHKGLVPDLTGRHVLLAGFGYTASPQATLDVAQRDSVVAQWQAIIKAGGGCAIVDPVGNTSPAVTGLPAVSVVLPPKPVTFGNCGTIVLSDAGTVGFIVGTAKFRDPPAAQATLRKLATTLKRGTEHITLIGSTSSEGGDAVNYPLSRRRADAVRAAVISLGIAPSRITAVGDGSHWPGRIADIGPHNVLLPAQAEQDREVIVRLPKCK